MKIKVCGMRNPENITELVALDVDFIGYIFHGKSSRNVIVNPKVEIPLRIKKVGVFVNETEEKIRNKVKEYRLNVVQLHGDESPRFCQELSRSGVQVMKAFSVDSTFDFSQLTEYLSCCNIFLFDSKGEHRGGNGTKFNWELLKQYTGAIPFLLSGGIKLTDIDEILQLDLKNMIGIGVNSGFEISPAVKDIDKVKIMVNEIRNHEKTPSK